MEIGNDCVRLVPPDFKFDSLDIFFECCPSCGIKLKTGQKTERRDE